jgi:VWFA-related protein
MSRSADVFAAIFLCLPALVCAQSDANPVNPTNPAGAAVQAPVLSPRKTPAPASAPTADVSKGRIDLDVVVTDKAGKAVQGLELKDFTLLDNGQPSKILSFHAIDATVEAASHPVEVILLIDGVNLDLQAVARSREEVGRFLRQNGGRLAQPVSIFIFNDDGVKILAQPSMDGNALAAQLDKADSQIRTINRSSQYGGFDRFDLSLKWMNVVAESEAKRPGRKLLIWAGSGWPLLDGVRVQISQKGQQELFNRIVDLSTTLREAHMSLYSVTLGQPGLSTFLYQDYLKGVKTAEKANAPNLGLKVLAVQSGGRVLGPDNDTAAQITDAIRDASAFYTLSFDPPKADRANEYHDLKVQIDQPGLTARTSTGYYNQP